METQRFLKIVNLILKYVLFAKFQVTYTEYKIEAKILGMQIADLPLFNILPSALQM